MITIEFRHIALFDTDGDGATVLFPASAHKAKVGLKGEASRELKGLCWIDGRDANGKAVSPKRTGWEKDGRIPSLSYALGKTFLNKKKARAASELLTANDIQASLRLTRGDLIAKRGEAACPEDEDYMDADWEIGSTKSKLTNRVHYQLEVEQGGTYTLVLENGLDTIKLSDGATVLIQNDEDPSPPCEEKELKPVAANTTADLVITDFAMLYTLLEGSPIGPPPKLKVTAGAVKTMMPARPLCPVGEP